MENFEARLEAYRAGVAELNRIAYDRDMVGDSTSAQGARILHEKFGYPTITLERGKRYVRVVRESRESRSVHSFVDTTNGDVLKADSWKKPAKHARGNIFAEDNGLKGVNYIGANYLS
jgi:hypothetical protein